MDVTLKLVQLARGARLFCGLTFFAVNLNKKWGRLSSMISYHTLRCSIILKIANSSCKSRNPIIVINSSVYFFFWTIHDVDGTGFELATSARNGAFASTDAFVNLRFIELTENEIDEILSKFSDWLEVDQFRKPRTIEHHRGWMRKSLTRTRKWPLSKDDYRAFLKKCARA